MLYLYILVYVLLLPKVTGRTIEIKCPRQCKCDIFENLKRATCSHRNLATIESTFPQETQILDLSHNQINQLDENLFKEEQLLSLKLLNISYNKVSHIHMRAFGGLTQLKTLDLSYNSVQYVLRNWFWDLESIEELYLRGNSFSKLTDLGMFASKSLKRLDISNCHTSYISPDTFQDLPNLQNLDISDNYLISLSVDAIKPLQNLEILNANNTKLSCDDGFNKLLKYCTQKGIRFVHLCSTPKKTSEKFQKMINMAPPDEEKNSWIFEEEEIKSVNETKIINKCNNTRVDKKSLLQEIVDLSPVLSILVPFIYGISVGVLITCIVQFCSTKTRGDLNENTYRSFDDDGSFRRRPSRLNRFSHRFDRTVSIEERQQLPLKEWKLSDSTPVLFRKNQVTF